MVALRHHVIHCFRILDAQGPGHDAAKLQSAPIHGNPKYHFSRTDPFTFTLSVFCAPYKQDNITDNK